MLIRKFVINLDRREDRLQEFVRNRPWDDVIRISAVDGQSMSSVLRENRDYLNKILHAVEIGFSKQVLLGAVGCSLSHYSVWKRIARNPAYGDHDLFLIMEDDCIFSDRVTQEWLQLVNQFEKVDFDLAYLGGRFTPNFRPADTPEWKQKEQNLFLRCNIKPRLKKGGGFDWDRCCFAYVVTKDCCRFLLYSAVTLMTLTIDYWLARVLSEAGKSSLDYFPHLFHGKRNHATDIQHGERYHLDEILERSGIGKLDYYRYRILRKVRSYLN